MSVWSDITDFLKNTVEPAMAKFFKEVEPVVVEALTPIATAAVASLSAELVGSAGNLTNFANAVGKTLQAAAQQAESAGIEATGAALLQTVSSAIAALQPTVAVTATTAPASN